MPPSRRTSALPALWALALLAVAIAFARTAPSEPGDAPPTDRERRRIGGGAAPRWDSTLPLGATQRLALIELPGGMKLPRELLDLATVRLTERADLELVERHELELVLAEQALALAQGSPDRTDSIRIGQLVNADALLLLAASAAKLGRYPVRVRLVDAHSGLKLWDETLPFHESSVDLEVSALADRVAGRLRALRSATAPPLVGVTGFHSREPARDWDWLGPVLAGELEQSLGRSERIVLVERQQTGALLDERRLTEGLPASIRSSTLLVEGDYAIDRGRSPVVTVRLRLLAGGSVVTDATIREPVAQLGALTTRLGDTVLAGVGARVTPRRSMAAAAETRLLVHRAETYLEIGDPLLALPPLEAAMALRPDAFAPKALYVDAVGRLFGDASRYIMGGTTPRHNYRLDQDDAEAFVARTLPKLVRGYEVARQLVRAAEFPPRWNTYRNGDVPEYQQRHRLTESLRAVLAGSHAIDFVLADDRVAPHLARVTSIERAAWDDIVQHMPGPPDFGRDACLALGLHNAHLWARSDSDRDTLIDEVLERAAALAPYAAMQTAQAFASYGFEARQGLAPDRWRSLLLGVSRHESPLLRAAAERSLAALANSAEPPDPARARAHQERFARLLIEEVVPTLENAAQSALHWYAVEGVEPEPAIHADQLRRLVAVTLARDVRSLYSEWHEHAARAVALSIELGQGREAGEWLAALTRVVDAARYYPQKERDRLALARLAKQLPRAAGDREARAENPVRPASARIVLDRADLAAIAGERARLVRLVRTDDDLAAVTVAGPPGAGQRLGVLRLDPHRLRPRGPIDVLDDEVEATDEETVAEESPGHPARERERAPPATAWGNEVIVGLTAEGIVRFARDRAPRRLQAADGLPSANIRGPIAVTADRLYAIIGEHGLGDGLIEVDLASDRAKLLISPRGSEVDGDLQGTWLNSLVADPDGDGLWLSAYDRSDELGRFGILSYDPRARASEAIGRLLCLGCNLRRAGNRILVHDGDKAGLLDPRARTIDWLYLRRGEEIYERLPDRPVYDRFRGPIRWRDTLLLDVCTMLGADLVCSARRPDTPSRLYRFEQSKKRAQPIAADGLPAAAAIGDLHAEDDELIVLSSDRLVAVRPDAKR